MTDIEKMILSDAIQTSIESERKIIKLKRFIGVLLVIIIILLAGIVYG